MLPQSHISFMSGQTTPQTLLVNTTNKSTLTVLQTLMPVRPLVHPLHIYSKDLNTLFQMFVSLYKNKSVELEMVIAANAPLENLGLFCQR